MLTVTSNRESRPCGPSAQQAHSVMNRYKVPENNNIKLQKQPDYSPGTTLFVSLHILETKQHFKSVAAFSAIC